MDFSEPFFVFFIHFVPPNPLTQRIVDLPASALRCANVNSLFQAAKPSIRQQLLASGASDARRGGHIVLNSDDEEQVPSLLSLLSHLQLSFTTHPHFARRRPAPPRRRREPWS